MFSNNKQQSIEVNDSSSSQSSDNAYFFPAVKQGRQKLTNDVETPEDSEYAELLKGSREEYERIKASKFSFWAQKLFYFFIKFVADVGSILFFWFLFTISLLHLTIYNSIYQIINVVSLPFEMAAGNLLLFICFFGVYLEFFRLLFIVVDHFSLVFSDVMEFHLSYETEIFPTEEEARAGITLVTKRKYKFIYYILIILFNLLNLLLACFFDTGLGVTYSIIFMVFLAYTYKIFFSCCSKTDIDENDQDERNQMSDYQNNEKMPEKRSVERLTDFDDEKSSNNNEKQVKEMGTFSKFAFIVQDCSFAAIINDAKETVKPNLFNRLNFDCRFPKAQIAIQIFSVLFILASIAIKIYFKIALDTDGINFYEKKFVVVFGYLFYLFIIPLAINFNIFDILINWKRTERVIGSQNMKYIKLLFGWYIFLGFVLLFFACYIQFYPQPYIGNLEYIEDNEPWFKYSKNYTYDIPPDFCQKSSMTDNLYHLEDFAMMATLPRLYGKTKDGKCFIKPNLRGVFNSTMKYIFGKDYQTQGIQIYCAGITDTPYLIISSDALLKDIKNIYFDIPEDAGNVNPNKVQGTDYFDVATLCKDGKAADECKVLKECISKNSGDCNKEWEKYTNKYWQSFSSDYQEIKGLEEFQINMEFPEDSKFIKPHISNEVHKLSGTHFIVGGGFESTWGYSYLIDILIRKYIPIIFENLIPIYSFYMDKLPGFFKVINSFATNLFQIDAIAKLDIDNVLKILNQIDLKTFNVFMIGHSISAATFKGISYLLDYPGVFLETVEGQYVNIKNSYTDGKLTRRGLLNIYEDDSQVSGFDEDIIENGKLISKFFNPNVFDTACLVSTTCSKTRKYVPFCQQVLAQHGEDPKEVFDKMVNDFLEDMDYTY